MVEYEISCVICGSKFTVTRKHPIFPAGLKDLAKYCSKCRSERMRGKPATNKRKGYRYIDKEGYVCIKIGNTFRAEHRVIMEKILGRPLRKGELVHHIDSNRSNNKPSNLELWIAPHVLGIKASDLICPHCGKLYQEKGK